MAGRALADKSQQASWWNQWLNCQVGKGYTRYGQAEYNVADWMTNTVEGNAFLIAGGLVNPANLAVFPALVVDSYWNKGIGWVIQKATCPDDYAPGFSHFPSDPYTMLDIRDMRKAEDGTEQSAKNQEQRRQVPAAPAPDRVPSDWPRSGPNASMK